MWCQYHMIQKLFVRPHIKQLFSISNDCLTDSVYREYSTESVACILYVHSEVEPLNSVFDIFIYYVFEHTLQSWKYWPRPYLRIIRDINLHLRSEVG